MVTTAAKKNSGGAGVALLLLAAIALAAGGGNIHAGGGQTGAGSGFNDPCQGKGYLHVLAAWTTSDGRAAKLRCGDDREGWRHILAGHPSRGATAEQLIECIGSTLTRGRYNAAKTRFEWRWAAGSGHVAAVVISAGEMITTAFPGRGGWVKCAEG